MNEYFTLCNTRRAHVNEFFTLAQQILQAAKEMLAETEAQPRIATYESAVTAFDEALKQSTKNSYTASIELADEAVDETWSALWGMTKIMVKHPNLDRRAAAALVYDIMYKYGNVTKLSYKEEYGRLHNLTQDLDNLGEEKLKLAYVDEWFAELKKRIATYKIAEEGRLGEEDARLVGAVKAAREATENALRQFLRQVEALILLNGESDYQAFVARANTLFSEMRTVLKSRQTRAANKTEEDGKADPSLPPRDPDPEIAPGLNDDEEEDGGTPGDI